MNAAVAVLDPPVTSVWRFPSVLIDPLRLADGREFVVRPVLCRYVAYSLRDLAGGQRPRPDAQLVELLQHRTDHVVVLDHPVRI